MPVEAKLLDRAGDLKRELVDFAHTGRYARHLDEALLKRFDRRDSPSERETINAIDAFILQHRLPDGRTVVEHFVKAHPGLPPAEREMLLGWRDAVEGIFRIDQHDYDTLIVTNLVDNLTHRVRSNKGADALATMTPGSFLVARLAPIADEWMLSGAQSLYPESASHEIHQAAVQLARSAPSLVFRNPALLEQAWEIQRTHRQQFIDFFGSDLVVVPGHELRERMRALMRYQVFEARDAEGRTAAERSQGITGRAVQAPEIELSDPLTEAETVGILCDEVDGQTFMVDFRLVEEAFAQPELIADPRHENVVRSYLEDSSISPRVIQRLAERDPERASRVFQLLLHQARFSWDRDGEALLHRHKASYYEHPVLPYITPLNETLTQAQSEASTPRKSFLERFPMPGRARKTIGR